MMSDAQSGRTKPWSDHEDIKTIKPALTAKLWLSQYGKYDIRINEKRPKPMVNDPCALLATQTLSM